MTTSRRPRPSSRSGALRGRVLRGAVVMAVLGCLAALASCSEAGTPIAATVDHDLGESLVWAGPGDVTVQRFQRSDDGCASANATIGTGSDRVSLTLLGAACRQTDRPPINGRHGLYLSPPSFATDVAHRGRVPTGTLVTFAQLYSEYTNSRSDYTDTVGLVTMTGGDHAVLMLLRTGDPGDLDPAAIVSVACAIRPAGAAAPSGSCPARS